MNENIDERQRAGEPGAAAMDDLAAALGEAVARNVSRSLEESGVLHKVDQLIEKLTSRIDKLESEVSSLRKRKPPVIPVTPPAVPVPSRPPSRPPSVRARGRSTPRPTVIYRSDPRAAGSASEDRDTVCSEPGCTRPARSRGLCSMHYQRLRYREKKIEHKHSSIDPLPPPPPASRPAASSRTRNGKSQAERARKSRGTRGIFAMLYDEKGRKLLAGLINQMKFDRNDLVKRINQSHADMPGVPLEEEDVVRSIHYHKLGDALYKRESEILCRHLAKQKGSLAKTAQKMKMDLALLNARIAELGLEDETTVIRNGFKEEVLERNSFQQRLDLALTKEKYLQDLGIVEEVDDSLRRELDEQIGRVAEGTAGDEAARMIREALSLDEERYRRLVKRFGLDESAGTTGSSPAAGGAR